MKITAIRSTPVQVPLILPAAQSSSSSQSVTRTIVEVETDEGLVGLGETGGADAATVISKRLAPLLLGLDPRERTAVRNRCLPLYNDYATPRHVADAAAFAGIEIALWDIIGQALGLPLYKVLGGAVRQRAPYSSYAFTIDLAEGQRESEVPGLIAARAKQQVAEMGAGLFEFKIGRHSVGCDIETVQELRRVLGPDVGIAVDANMRYTVDKARQFLRRAADDIDNFEEPCSSLSQCVRLRRDFGVPISTHCVDFDVLRALPEIDAVVGAIDQQGGIARSIELCTAAFALGKRYWFRSCIELGIAWAAMAHVAVAAHGFDRPSQGLIHWIDDDLVEGAPWLVRQGGVAVKDEPGLGVRLDRDAFRRAAEMWRNSV